MYAHILFRYLAFCENLVAEMVAKSSNKKIESKSKKIKLHVIFPIKNIHDDQKTKPL